MTNPSDAEFVEPEILGELTANEIEEFDNVNHDLAGADRAMEVAMNYYMNKRSFLQRDIDSMWRRLADRLNIENVDAVKIQRVRGTVRVVMLTEEEMKLPGYMRTIR
jgi:hypothetical protein